MASHTMPNAPIIGDTIDFERFLVDVESLQTGPTTQVESAPQEGSGIGVRLPSLGETRYTAPIATKVMQEVNYQPLVRAIASNTSPFSESLGIGHSTTHTRSRTPIIKYNHSFIIISGRSSVSSFKTHSRYLCRACRAAFEETTARGWLVSATFDHRARPRRN